MPNFVLFEMASGYALFKRTSGEDIAQETEQVQQSMQDLSLFGKLVKLKAFMPFKNAAEALENINEISEGLLPEKLRQFLEMNLPRSSKKPDKISSKLKLGISERNLAGSIKAELGVNCETGELINEIIRGIRLHASKLISQMDNGLLEKAQLGLGHSYSRAKVQFNVNRSDVMVTQAIFMLDLLDKDINTFAMRVREWYSWHFPELAKIVSNHALYAKLVKFIKNKSSLTDESLEKLEKIFAKFAKDEREAAGGDASSNTIGDPAVMAKRVIDASKSSMGTDISEVDMLNIQSFSQRVLSLIEYRQQLQVYLRDKMSVIAPNLASLIGDTVGARLISHAGSLTNLSKYPASTVQILGAEKALFRALKTRGNTPKYGLIFHSSFIGRAGARNKGRISRYLANKCSMAARIDCFSEEPTAKFGMALKEQVEDRLKFYETGEPVKKNADVMRGVMNDLMEED